MVKKEKNEREKKMTPRAEKLNKKAIIFDTGIRFRENTCNIRIIDSFRKLKMYNRDISRRKMILSGKVS